MHTALLLPLLSRTGTAIKIPIFSLTFPKALHTRPMACVFNNSTWFDMQLILLSCTLAPLCKHSGCTKHRCVPKQQLRIDILVVTVSVVLILCRTSRHVFDYSHKPFGICPHPQLIFKLSDYYTVKDLILEMWFHAIVLCRF